MNKKVIKAMLALVIIFLVGLYILKIFIPDTFVMVIENPQLIAIGDYIDSHTWAFYIYGFTTSTITYYLYFAACFKQWGMNWKQLIALVVVVGGNFGFSFVNPQICAAFGILAMFIVPMIFKADMRYTAIIFCTHYLAQTLTLMIRNLPMYLTSVNSIIMLFVTLEMYFWLLLFYIYPHIKEDKANGMDCTTTIRGNKL